MQLSQKLRFLLSKYGITQEQLGVHLDIAQTTVGRWLKGSTRPYDRHAIKLAEFFNIPLSELMDDDRELTTMDMLVAEDRQAKAIHPDNLAASDERFTAMQFERKLRQERQERISHLRALADQMSSQVKQLYEEVDKLESYPVAYVSKSSYPKPSKK